MIGCHCHQCYEIRRAAPQLKQPSWVWLIGWITTDAQADALIRDLDEEALPKKERRKRARARDKAARRGRQKLLAQLHGSYTANRRAE